MRPSGIVVTASRKAKATPFLKPATLMSIGWSVPRRMASVAGNLASPAGAIGWIMSVVTTLPSAEATETPISSMSVGTLRLASMARRIAPGAGSCFAEQARRRERPIPRSAKPRRGMICNRTPD